MSEQSPDSQSGASAPLTRAMLEAGWRALQPRHRHLGFDELEAVYRAMLAARHAEQDPVGGAPAPVAQWGDPRVQKVYDLICDDTDVPPPEQHWEGWLARRIVDALYAGAPPSGAEPPGELKAIAQIARQEHDAGDGQFSTAQVEMLERLAGAPPSAPPVDDAHVAIGCTRFSDGELQTEETFAAAQMPGNGHGANPIDLPLALSGVGDPLPRAPTSGAAASRLGDFVHSTGEERGRVYERVISAAIDAQKAVLVAGAPPSDPLTRETAYEFCSKRWITDPVEALVEWSKVASAPSGSASQSLNTGD